MHEHKRIMVSAQVSRENNNKWFPNMRDGTFIPIVWFDEVGALKQEAAAQFQVALTVRSVGQYTMYAAGGTGVLTFIAGIILWVRG